MAGKEIARTKFKNDEMDDEDASHVRVEGYGVVVIGEKGMRRHEQGQVR